jgi:N-dimethylarginine dimethylaminohydrolase
MATFLLSYPGDGWRIVGAENFRSERRAPTFPRQARAEWLGLADAITAAGAEVAVLAPPAVEPPLTGLVYTANAGHLFSGPRRFRLSQMTSAHRREEPLVLARFLADAGVPVERAEHPWEGQAELLTDEAGRYLLTWGVRSAPESVDEVRAALPEDARVLGVRLRPPFYHGDTCLGLFRRPGGGFLLLVYPGALLGTTAAELARFFGPDVEVYPVGEEDAHLYACNSLAVGGALLAVRGLSAGLLEALKRRGFEIVELALDELFGKGGGGPRALVNRLGELQIPEASRYKNLRDSLAPGDY